MRMRDYEPTYTRHRRSVGVLSALAVPLILLAMLDTGCATVAPGQDSIVVNAERLLKAAPPIWDAAITFAEQNKASLSLSTRKAFEAVRVNFPPALRAFDSAVQAYRISKSSDPTQLLQFQDEINRLLGEASSLVKVNGGPDLGLGR